MGKAALRERWRESEGRREREERREIPKWEENKQLIKRDRAGDGEKKAAAAAFSLLSS